MREFVSLCVCVQMTPICVNKAMCKFASQKILCMEQIGQWVMIFISTANTLIIQGRSKKFSVCASTAHSYLL